MKPSAGKTFLDKVWGEHVITALDDKVDLLQIDRLILHELSGSQVLRALRQSGRAPDSPPQVFTMIDHLISTRPGRHATESMSPSGAEMISATRAESLARGLQFIDFDDPRQGIAHVIAPEQGIAFPGGTLVCCDSHTSTVGGIGALAWGIGASEAEHVLATQTLPQAKPRQMRVRFDGALPTGVTAKDMVLALIGEIGAQGGIGYAAEFTGSAVSSLSVEGRMTLCNMSIEFSCKYGYVPPDAATLEYLHGRAHSPTGEAWEAAAAHWLSLRSDDDAQFDLEVAIDCNALQPQVTWGTSPQHVVSVSGSVPDPDSLADAEQRKAALRALDYMRLAPGTPLIGVPIDAAYIGSCTNARLSDLRAAAEVLRGKKVKAGVQAVCVPGSTPVKRAAEAEGIDRIFKEAGFEWRESACGLCAGLGDTRFADLRVISTTNRNFEGRQGAATRTHLASPATVAASAIAGCIADARRIV
ncbi:MAG TPA: 3-isopropylmalate dehydratase large subunit [Burkholderiales bacterium]|jgi:3-isopropylmalate/(R)-2-methylmalate dehydratase large subunit|nr:3-isopropylmalate dehydratase large subunit [Burkholderiales bacterium]